MTRDDIIELAIEAGVSIRGHYDETGSTPAELQRFAELVAAAEHDPTAVWKLPIGTKLYIASAASEHDPTAVWKLPIGTKLYTASAAPEHDPELVRDAERYRWLQRSNWYVGPDSFFCTEGGDLVEYDDKNVSAGSLSAAIDAAIAAKKGGAP